MSDENTSDSAEHQNPVFKTPDFKADASQPTTMPMNTSKEWKARCLDVLQAYRKHKEEQLGQSYGASRLRDEIMRETDSYDGDRLLGRSSLLSAQNVQSWLDGSIPKDDKFAYLQKFVLRLQMDEDSFSPVAALKDSFINERLEAFSSLYLRRGAERTHAHRIFNSSLPYLVSNPLYNSRYRLIIIRFDGIHASAIKVTVCYLNSHEGQLSETHVRYSLFYEGFLFPHPTLTEKSIDRLSAYFDEGNEIERYRCMLKLYRPECRGNPYFGYIDAQLLYFFPRNTSQRSITIQGTFSNSLSSPYPDAISDERLEGKYQKEPLKLSFTQEIGAREKLDKIFALGYKGYLF